ncbi:MAG: ABC transporter ATP-binding protein, partial [Proteobacteria bacterium]|nr:ABC transporter ATP-binding protein [Pseudomonadota bacterium]
RLFTRPSNLLVLDEPTNDLDTETLELLEDLLMKYKGTLLLVSHDRAFINNVVTSTIVFEGDGRVKEYVGGYDDWLQQRPEEKAGATKKESPPAPLSKAKPRFGYRQQRELESLPQIIELLETEQKELFQYMSDPDFYRKDKAEIVATQQRLESVKERLISAYNRWGELEEIKDGK